MIGEMHVKLAQKDNNLELGNFMQPGRSRTTEVNKDKQLTNESNNVLFQS